MKFNITYKQLLNESLMVNKPEFLLQTYCDINPNDIIVLSDGRLDVDASVEINERLIKNGKLIVKFNRVNYDFQIGNFDTYLTSLEGCPVYVGKDFFCDDNYIKDLTGGPGFVSGNYYCSYSKITSLKGCPKTIGGSFTCNDNKLLKSLDNCPEKIGSYFEALDCGKEFTIEEVMSRCDVAYDKMPGDMIYVQNKKVLNKRTC